MDEQSDVMTISSRNDFAQWAIERAKAIVAEEGANLALAARDGDDTQVADTANALGLAIVTALVEVFDGFVSQE